MAKTALTPEPAIYCRTCSYDLRGQVEHRCPECGRRFEPDDPRTFIRRPPRLRLRRWAQRLGMAAVPVVLMASMVQGWLYYQWRSERGTILAVCRTGAKISPEPVGWPAMPFRWGRQPHLLDHVKRLKWETRQAYVVDLEADSDLVRLTEGDRRLVDDAMLAHVARMPALCDLSVDDTRITDAGLEHLRGLKGLKTLTLSGCEGVTDAGLGSLASLTALEYLNLDWTGVRGPGLKHLAGMQNLTTLSLQSVPLTGDGARALPPLPQLNWLAISAKDVIDDGVLASLAPDASLRNLFLGNISVTDDGVTQIETLPQLDWLRIGSNRITDEGLIRLVKLPRLRRLNVYVEGSQITEPGITRAEAEAKPRLILEREGHWLNFVQGRLLLLRSKYPETEPASGNAGP